MARNARRNSARKAMFLTRRQFAFEAAEESDEGSPVCVAASGDADAPVPEPAPGPSSTREHAGGPSSARGPAGGPSSARGHPGGPSSARGPAGENAQADAPEDSQGAKTEMFTFESFSPGFFWKHKLSENTCSICYNDMNYQCGGCDEREEENNQGLRTRFVPSCPIAWGECGHVFHNHCLRRWLSTSEGQTCPIDRGQFVLRRAE